MHLIATVATLAISRLCVAEPNQSSALGEPAFGIEFSMENVKISFVPSGSHTKGLASVKGNETCRDLMYSYFELCCWVHSDQVPPWSYEENGTTASHALYVAAIEGIPNQVSWRYEAHPNETDVDILADAVRTAKMVATEILAERYHISMPDRPLVTLAAPNFMWTMTELDFWDGEFDPERGMSYNHTRDDWHHGFAVKLSDAVREAGFRLEPVDDTNAAIAPSRLNQTFPIAQQATQLSGTPISQSMQTHTQQRAAKLNMMDIRPSCSSSRTQLSHSGLSGMVKCGHLGTRGLSLVHITSL
jgi:hypothetical protein